MQLIVTAPAHRCDNLPCTWPERVWYAEGTEEEIMAKALRDVVHDSATPPPQFGTSADLAHILGIHPRRLHIREV